MNMKIPIYIVDAFSPRPFGGNPAAVCLLDKDLPDNMKQNIAAEMNLSETAFVLPLLPEKEPFKLTQNFSLRWFTPTAEVPLCGHATLAAAAVLFYKKGNDQALNFHTVHSGTLVAVRTSHNTSQKIEMKLPLNAPKEEVDITNDPAIRDLVHIVLQSTSLKLLKVMRSSVTKKLLIQVDSLFGEETLESLDPNTEAMMAVDTSDRVRGVIVTMSGKSDAAEPYHFKSRYFAPWVGIPEDPVTGSAHTVLAPFWHQESQDGRKEFFAKQCSKRGGEIWIKVDEENCATIIQGEAKVVLEGCLDI